jgi:MoaA/NifB/PqqE/SkfB family radical SAM enzyme
MSILTLKNAIVSCFNSRGKRKANNTSTIVDLIFSLYPYGMQVNGVSFIEKLIPGTHPCGDGSFREGNEETFFRWFAGPKTVLKFSGSGQRKMKLYLGFINTFLGQDVEVEINGHKIEQLKGIKDNVVVRKRYVFQGQADNEIILRYKLTNASTNQYPYDSRDVAEMFFEFKVVDADIDAKDASYAQRFDYSSITYLGSPVKNAELNRKEYQEGKTVLKSLPSVVTLALTTHCNNKTPCMICDRNTRPSFGDCEIDQKMIETTIPLLKTATYILLHCGGEAMFSRYYDQVIESIAPPTRITFATNAMLMTHKRVDLMLKKDIMAGIVISLDAATPEMYRIMRPGSKFETVVDNVAYYIAKAKELGRNHSNVTLNMTLCEANICDAPKLVDLAGKIGAWGVDFNHLNSGLSHKAITADGWEWDYIEQADFKDKNQHDRLVLETYQKAKERGIHISLVGKPFLGPDASKYQEIVDKMTGQVAFQEGSGAVHWHSPDHKRLGAHIPPCFKPWQEIVIQPDGTIRLCYFHDLQIWSLGHLGRSDFMSIWNSDQMVAARKQFLSHAVARACSESQPCMHRGRE